MPLLIRSLSPTLALFAIFCVTLAACDNEDAQPAPDVHRLATDIHVIVADHKFVVPFASLQDHLNLRSFHIGQKIEHGSQDSYENFLRDGADADRPIRLSSLSVAFPAHGWNDADQRQIALCQVLGRAWSQSVCDNPWAAVLQALPWRRFELVDLSNPRAIWNCYNDQDRKGSRISIPKKAEIVCEITSNTSLKIVSYTAVVRIDGELGAIWTVSEGGHHTETAEAQAQREAAAIVAMARYGIGPVEDFAALHPIMCRLRRPGSSDHPKGSDCPDVR